jgi:hypothetical protein
MSSGVLDRDALYYPYIHIRPNKVDWLKATLLCFPQVRRMVPHGFNPDDKPEIRAFLRAKNAKGQPLLISERLEANDRRSAVARAQERLLRKLKEHESIIVERFSRRSSGCHYGKINLYTMHREKIHDEIWNYLIDNNLAKARGRKKNDPYGDWVDIEPALGDAIMSTIAVALARAKGLDIVTSDNGIHNAVAMQSEDDIFNTLLNLKEPEGEESDGDKVDELAQVVIRTKFNVSKLSAEQISELHKEGKSLIAFKKALLPIASQITKIEDPGERESKFKQKADEVIEEWEKYKRKLPGFAAAALVEAQETKPPEYALSLIATTGTAMWIPVLGAAITLGVLSYKGYSIWKKFKEGTANPYQYLTQVERKGATLVAAPSTKKRT